MQVRSTGEERDLPSEPLLSRETGKLTTTPPSYIQPTIVVPVLVALGKGTPRACRAALRL